MFDFENSYLNLPEKFYTKVIPTAPKKPNLILFNKELAEELGLNFNADTDLDDLLSGAQIPKNSTPFAQAYAGHQFGHFTMLGDGRAILLGEHITPMGKRFDIQLKGSGQTAYSRRGDGKATLKSMLREYLFSEALHNLRIPSSRSLSVTTTGEPVFREKVNEGAVLCRIMKSHIRVGTFEYAAYYAGKEFLNIFFDYTLDRLYPELKNSENPALAFLGTVTQNHIDLVINWMRVGFIHGVMNTDNVAISAETFDYGPCAFMNIYHPDTVFSSIDENGRYAFENQASITKWNMAKLAESLLPLIHSEEEKAVELAVGQLNRFEAVFRNRWLKMMASKIGIINVETDDMILVSDLLELMKIHRADYTNTFTALWNKDFPKRNLDFWDALIPWKKKWKQRLLKNNGSIEEAIQLMKNMNPFIIPRNIHVEKALFLAEQGDLKLFRELLQALKNPYDFDNSLKDFLIFDSSFDDNYKTYCGT